MHIYKKLNIYNLIRWVMGWVLSQTRYVTHNVILPTSKKYGILYKFINKHWAQKTSTDFWIEIVVGPLIAQVHSGLVSWLTDRAKKLGHYKCYQRATRDCGYWARPGPFLGFPIGMEITHWF